MRTRHIWDKAAKKWVPYEKRPRGSQGIMVISDVMDDVKSMADGKHYSSKSRYRAEIRARGYEEVGNERVSSEPPQMSDPAADIVETMKARGEW